MGVAQGWSTETKARTQAQGQGHEKEPKHEHFETKHLNFPLKIIVILTLISHTGNFNDGVIHPSCTLRGKATEFSAYFFKYAP